MGKSLMAVWLGLRAMSGPFLLCMRTMGCSNKEVHEFRQRLLLNWTRCLLIETMPQQKRRRPGGYVICRMSMLYGVHCQWHAAT